MKTFHKDSDKNLLGHLKEAAKKTMSRFKGKELPPYLSKKAIVFAAVAAMSFAGSNAEAKGFLDKILGTMEKVAETAEKVTRPFYEFNRQYDRTGMAINGLKYEIQGTDARLGGALSMGANAVKGVVDRAVANRALDAMDMEETGTVPLVAEEGQRFSGSQRYVSSNSTDLNVVGEISLDELIARNNGNVTVAGDPTVSSSIQSVSRTSGLTMEELQSYVEGHSSPVAGVKARKAALDSQKAGSTEVKAQTSTPTQKRTLSTEELFAQMQAEGYIGK